MLNMNKTQLLNISRTASIFPSVIIDSITIVPCNNVKNLDFIFDDMFDDMICKVLKNRLPSYLISILQFKVYKRNLRNASTRLL